MKHILVVSLACVYFWLLHFPSVGWAQVTVKANVASAPLLIPNVGVGLQIGEKSIVQLDVLASFWNEFPWLDDSPLLINQTFFEYRRFFRAANRGWFLGPHVGYGMFTIQKPNFLVLYDHYDPNATWEVRDSRTYQSGRVMFYGVTMGYAWQINDRWGLEAFLGGGLTQSWYKGYGDDNRVDNLQEKRYRPFNGSGEVALYRGGLMLTYQLPLYLAQR
jgi:hypothetical protein